jgi:DedD protein
LLFDTQPRPVAVDIAVDIPDRANSKPLVDTSKQKPLSAGAGLDAKEEVVPEAKPEVKAEAKPEAKSDAKPSDSKDTGARFVVQVGAFSDEAKVREVLKRTPTSRKPKRVLAPVCALGLLLAATKPTK